MRQRKIDICVVSLKTFPHTYLFTALSHGNPAKYKLPWIQMCSRKVYGLDAALCKRHLLPSVQVQQQSTHIIWQNNDAIRIYLMLVDECIRMMFSVITIIMHFKWKCNGIEYQNRFILTSSPSLALNPHFPHTQKKRRTFHFYAKRIIIISQESVARNSHISVWHEQWTVNSER